VQQTGIQFGSTCRVLKKHLHLHPYKITSGHELKEMDIKHVEYIQWFRDNILDITFLPLSFGFIYLLYQQPKQLRLFSN
jgi:hypothetical protein